MVTSVNGFEEFPGGFDMGQAIAEANRCLLCHDAPCSKGCPAGTDPGKFIRKLRFRNVTGAIRTIKENNILGGACGVLCPTAALCEKECSATAIDRPIRIGKLQRFLVEHAHETGFNVFSPPEQKLPRVAVVGAGPAGIACASEMAKSGFPVVVFEKMPEPGGVLRYGVPAHRFPREFLDKEIEDVKRLGVEFRCSTPIKDRGEAEALLKNGFSAVFLSPGLWQSIPLGPSGKSGSIFSSVDFLKGLREGKSPEISKFIQDKTVAVIGGGSVAMDCAESAMRLGAKDVFIVYRRSFNEMPAMEDEKIDALRAGIHFLILTKPLDYRIDDGGRLKGINLVRTRLGEADSSGRPKPMDIPGSEWTLGVDTVIEAIGQKPEDGSTEWYPSIKVDRNGLIQAEDETGETSVRGIFAGGDIVRGPSLIVNAIRDGKRSASAITNFLLQEVPVC